MLIACSQDVSQVKLLSIITPLLHICKSFSFLTPFKRFSSAVFLIVLVDPNCAPDYD